MLYNLKHTGDVFTHTHTPLAGYCRKAYLLHYSIMCVRLSRCGPHHNVTGGDYRRGGTRDLCNLVSHTRDYGNPSGSMRVYSQSYEGLLSDCSCYNDDTVAGITSDFRGYDARHGSGLQMWGGYTDGWSTAGIHIVSMETHCIHGWWVGRHRCLVGGLFWALFQHVQ